MKVFFDTSVLVAAFVQPHPEHTRAIPWMKRAKAQELDMVVSSHTLAELYAVLTTLPVSPRIAPAIALSLIHENVEKISSVVSLSASDYIITIKHLGELGLFGGLTYDALLFKAALKADVDRILTLNVSDFKRAWPHERIEILAP